MSLNKPWVSALRIDPSQFQLWQSQKPNSSSITFWCLDTHKVKLLDYLQWARDHFEIAVVKEAYFEKSPSAEFWNKIKSVANWSPELLPLDEWDGVVFVGCVEPPEDIQWSFPVRYLLASPKSLNHRWQQLQKGQFARATAAATPVLTSKAVSAASPVVPPPPPSEETSFDSLELNLNAPAETTEESSETPEDSRPAMPEGLSLENLKIEPLKFNTDSGIQLSENAVEKNSDVAPENLSANTDGGLGSLTGVSGFSDPLSKPISTAPSAPAPQGSVIDTHRLAPSDLAAAKSTNEAVAWAFERLRTHFQHSMILLFEGEKLKPWRWETAWAPRSEENFKSFDLTQPSLFRIVQRTKLPYHGHIVPSEANVHFFLNWGHESLPAHVTAVPLIVNSDMMGVMIAIGDANSNTPEILDFSERIAMPLAQALIRFMAKAA